MAYKDRPPLTDRDGEVRELSDEDMLWLVNSADFGGFEAATIFLNNREALLSAAEAVGIAREVFLPFEPSKPGFEDRARQAFEAFLNATRHAAE